MESVKYLYIKLIKASELRVLTEFIVIEETVMYTDGLCSINLLMLGFLSEKIFSKVS